MALVSPYRNRWAKLNASPLPHYINFLPTLPIQSAWRDHSPPYQKREPHSRARLAGLRFEQKALDWLPQDHLIRSPWFQYLDYEGRLGRCQPDFIIDLEEVLIIGEIKLKFHSDAYLQLEKKYIPVVKKALCASVGLCLPLAVCHSFDPAIPLPRRAHLISNLAEIEPKEFNVLIVR